MVVNAEQVSGGLTLQEGRRHSLTIKGASRSPAGQKKNGCARRLVFIWKPALRTQPKEGGNAYVVRSTQPKEGTRDITIISKRNAKAKVANESTRLPAQATNARPRQAFA